jgi:hypothetical protein
MPKEKESTSKIINETTVWENCLKLIRDNVNPQNFKTWFEPIKAVKLEQNTLTIEASSFTNGLKNITSACCARPSSAN